MLQAADGGTIFLDEIGELPVDLQSKLLRALQEKEVRPVGGTKPVAIDVRVLAATNRDLELAVAQGAFRKDLYFRLNVLSLRIPSLRQRKQDIPLLVGHFLERLSRSTGLQRNVSDDALKLMLSYDWPGNVRELENCIERACALTSGPTVHIADLPTTIQNWREQSEPAAERWCRGAASCPSPRWSGRRFWAPSSCCTATSWKRRGCLASAKPPCIANSKSTARCSRLAATRNQTHGCVAAPLPRAPAARTL